MARNSIVQMNAEVYPKKIKCTCAHCGKELWKTPSEIKRSKTGNVFCNRSCAASFNNSKFRTGKKIILIIKKGKVQDIQQLLIELMP